MARKRYDNRKGKAQVGEYVDAPLQLKPREDGLFAGKGRGAGLNPGNRFETVRLHVLGEYLDHRATEADDQPPAQLPTQVLPDQAKTIINEVQSELVGFDWTLNPYRGCAHGCIYCYARTYHEYLGYSCGIDFETKLMAKYDAANMLRRELAHPRWQAATIIMSGITDCWQPIEAELQISRQCLAVLAECRQPVSIITKSKLLLRDLDYLIELHRHQCLAVTVTITTLDNRFASLSEPRASSPRDRLELVAALSKAGLPVNVNIAPVIPGLTDHELPAILKAVAEAGAVRAGYMLMRLPWQLKELYEDWLRRHFPQRAEHALNLLREVYGGRLYDADAAWRARGKGRVAQQVGQVFKVFARKYGLDQPMPHLNHGAFRRPQLDGQGLLFE